MKRPYLLIAIIIAVLAGGGIYYLVRNWEPINQVENPPITENKIPREEVMGDLSAKIADISPAKPVLGGNWYITRFWFIRGDNKDFYVEYEDGHIMARMLLEAEKKDEKLNYKILAYFEPGENDWILKQGDDKFSGAALDLYEYSEELEQWIKKN